MSPLDINIISSIAGWFGEVWDQIRSVDIQYLILGCFFQSVQTILNGLAWRNILRRDATRHRERPARGRW